MKKDLIITIFGSTGDLTARKLLPAVASLYNSGSITKNLMVIAVGRRNYDTRQYLEQMNKVTKRGLDIDLLMNFVTYYQMEITKKEEYANLKNLIDDNSDLNTKHLYYLAIAPTLFSDVASSISESGLVQKHSNNQTIIFEKPFGNDLESAKQINKKLWQYFSEEQIYRIDHYLGKEMIQNIMTMRFANRIFEEVWNKRVIKNIKIVAKEVDGILNRASYYNESGAVKDMLQSHLLEVLALVAMDTPKS